MTGAEHYREAEDLLEYVYVGAARDGAPLERDEVPEYLARAKVHALLAIAAANGLNEAVGGMPEPDRTDWQQVAGHALPGKDSDR